MNEKHGFGRQQEVQLTRWQVWAMSFVCGFLVLWAGAAASRLPLYVAAGDYVRLVGAVLFALLVVVGVIDNVRAHICLRRMEI